jgi:Family of unknown function (DUF6267)
MNLLEGGNVFKDANGQPATQRINQSDVPATVQWIETLTGIEFPRDRWLGSTGRVATSGDLDLAVDLGEVNKDQLAQKLMAWAQSHGEDPRAWVKKGGEVHLRTPINGRPENGFVQTDFMFFPDLNWGTFFYAGGEDSAYKGMVRNVLLSSLAKSQGLKIGANGVINRASNQVVSLDPDWAATTMLGKGHDRNSLKNVESIYNALARDPERDVKLKDFREYLQREGLKEPGTVNESDAGFLARLRDRIVNQGMMPLIEDEDSADPYYLYEAEAAGVGGRAKGIEHLEDLVFRHGSRGVEQALNIVAHVIEQPSSATVKWDGKPAVVFGRKPATGEFVLTDGSGFEAKGYDGLATSPGMMSQIQTQRGGDRSEIIQIYATLFPLLESAVPANFRGYVKGDLLYMATPTLVSGNYVFRPNTVEYRIPAKSSLGQRIANSEVGIAMHSMYGDVGDPRQPLSRVKFNDVPGLLLLEPISGKTIELNQKLIKEIRALLRSKGQAIDILFNPAELRSQQITDLARLCVDYINARIPTGNFDNLLAGFGEWLQQRVTPRKFNNIIEYLKSPTSNTEGLAAAFTLFLLLHDLKMDVLQQLDQQSPGNEGWVMATPQGYAKAVNRFDFTARNRARNNP